MLPMLSMLERGRARARMPRTLILEPTRELAAQVEEAFGKYGVNHKLNVALIIGGVSFGDQEAKIDARRRRADRDARPPARSHRARRPAAHRRRDPGHRRGRPHARHGLHPRHRAHLQAGAVHPPDAVLLRHHAAGDHPPRRARSCTIRCASRSPAPPPPPRTSPRRWCLRRARPRREARDAAAPHPRRREFQERDHLLQPQARRRRWSTVRCRSTASRFCALHGDLDQRMRMAALDAFRAGEVQLLVCSDVAAAASTFPTSAT